MAIKSIVVQTFSRLLRAATKLNVGKSCLRRVVKARGSGGFKSFSIWLKYWWFWSINVLRFLENEIHKTNLKLMEGETIKKKYTSILDMLR